MRRFFVGFIAGFSILAAPSLAAQSGCDSSFRPIVFVHGFLASGDTWARFFQEFQAAGYCPEHLLVYDWNTLGRDTDHNAALDAAVDSLRARTGAERVDLIGHSAGGGLGYLYLTDSTRAAKVARFVQIGSMSHAQPAGPNGGTPTLNLWSDGDRVVSGREMPGASNIMLPGLDHYQIATGKASFEAVFRFLNDAPPKAAVPEPEGAVRVGGRAVFFGDNKAVSGAKVELYYLDARSGARSGKATAIVNTDAKGYWAVPDVRPNVPIELVVQAPDSSRPVHYFREGFSHSNRLVYLRVLPKPGTMVGILLAGLPNDSDQSVVNVFSASQALITGRDSLSLDGVLISTEQHAAAEKTAISFFLYDGNKNKKSDLAPIGMFGRFPFLIGVDFFIDPKKSKPMTLLFNGRRQVIRKLPSSEGIQVVVFD